METGGKGRVDWGLVAAAAGLALAGTIAILSAANPMPYYTQILQRHLLALAIGALLFAFGLGFNYQVFQDQSKIVYAAVVAILVAVLLFGTTQRGQRAWFHLPYVSFQPAELARIGFTLTLAAFLDRRSRRIREFSTVFWALVLAAPIMGLILKQPDFSSTLTFFPILIGMLFCAGADLWHLFAVFGFGLMAMAVPVLYTFCQVRYPLAQAGSLPHIILQTSRMGLGTLMAIFVFAGSGFAAWRLAGMMRLHARAVYFVAIPAILSVGLLAGIAINRQLKGYQRNRFVAFVAPQSDIQGASYNVHQSQIAIGSGGLWGKGLFSGTQSQLGFLPERHTDFIYAVVGEETGFVGSLGILALYMTLIWRIVAAARSARDRYGFLVCSGLASMFAFYLALNVGMCLGLMPVAGIPLPLISYGGSSLVITLWALGIAGNVYARRYSLL